jgi:hypothetical protein
LVSNGFGPSLEVKINGDCEVVMNAKRKICEKCVFLPVIEMADRGLPFDHKKGVYHSMAAQRDIVWATDRQDLTNSCLHCVDGRALSSAGSLFLFGFEQCRSI